MKIYNSINRILDCIYPQVCGICGKLNKNSLCKRCEMKLRKLALFNIEDYKDSTSYFDEHIYMFHYDGVIRNLLLDYKFNERNYLFRTILNFLKKNENFCVQIKKYDIITSVPISKKRLKERGYNQSSIFASNLAYDLKMKYLENILIKVKNNYPQSSLKKENREENVKNAYKINKRKEKLFIDRKILIVDDIFTTGNTVNECAKILKKLNVKQVGVLTIAKD